MTTTNTVELMSATGDDAALHLLRVPCNTLLQFVIRCGAQIGSVTNKMSLMTNCPQSPDAEFERHTFHRIEADAADTHTGTDLTAVQFTFMVHRAGAFQFDLMSGKNKKLKSGAFVVKPMLTLRGVQIQEEAVTMETVLTKCLGNLEEWEGMLQPVADAGYNFIHFTPIQQLGESNSCYSIYHQLSVSDSIVPRAKGESVGVNLEQRLDTVKDKIDEIEEVLGVGSITDIVLNHTANNTMWLRDHPEAAYTSLNCPHLHAAIELEDAMLELSRELHEDGQTESLRSESTIHKVFDVFAEEVLPKYKLWEYFMVDVRDVREVFDELMLVENGESGGEERTGSGSSGGVCVLDVGACGADGKSVIKDGCSSAEVVDTGLLELLTDAGFIQSIVTDCVRAHKTSNNQHSGRRGRRHCWAVDVDLLLTRMRDTLDTQPHIFPSDTNSMWIAVDAVMGVVNKQLRSRYEHDVKAAIDAMRSTAKFEWVDRVPSRADTAMLHPDEMLPLVDPYFTRVRFSDQATDGDRNVSPSPDPSDISSESNSSFNIRSLNSSSSINSGNGNSDWVSSVEGDVEADQDGGVAGVVVVAYANNGFIWGGDPSVDFGMPGPMGHADPSCAYFRRELVIWGDCVKLRYGAKPEDSPWLWDLMRTYTRQMARLFHGFRIDNAHGTPKHVAIHMLDAARKIRPNLLVQAELFTGSESVDAQYVMELGIDQLVREAMQAPDPLKLADLIYRHGGRPVGSLGNGGTLSRQNVLPVVFFDCTHDNETPTQKRTTQDALSNCVLVAMSDCATGSVKGYDELVPKNPNVVTETRRYRSSVNLLPTNPTPGLHKRRPSLVAPLTRGPPTNLLGVKRIMNLLHGFMSRESMHEVHVEHRPFDLVRSIDAVGASVSAAGAGVGGGESLIIVTRACSKSGRSVVAITRPAFHSIENSSMKLPDVFVPGTVVRIVMGAAMLVRPHAVLEYEKDPMVVNGLNAKVDLHEADLGDLATVVTRIDDSGAPESIVKLNPSKFVPGSAVVLLCSALTTDVATSLGHHRLFNNPTSTPTSPTSPTSSNPQAPRLQQHPDSCFQLDRIFKQVQTTATTDGNNNDCPTIPKVLTDLTLEDLQVLLFSCDNEERDRTGGRSGSYQVPGQEPFFYAGIAGVYAAMRAIERSGNMGDALLDNIRQGNWLIEYLSNRIGEAAVTESNEGKVKNAPMQRVRGWLAQELKKVEAMAISMRPRAVYRSLSCLYSQACAAAFTHMSPFIRNGNTLVQSLAMTSVALFGYVPSAPLVYQDSNAPRVEYLLAMFQPPTKVDESNKPVSTTLPQASLAAGLTHFCTGFMRNWGRDTFIAMRGLLLVTGRFMEARNTILAYASVVRHGLVPNLMDGGNNPRYNARDATWWFLQAVQDYCTMAPEGVDLLLAPVRRLFPFDRLEQHRAWEQHHFQPIHEQPLHDVIHEILSKHAAGIHFVEWFAGKKLDEHMSEAGFNVEIRLDARTGVLSGGNEYNCGTWMDKMGSVPGVNACKPATPRDGAPIEITALLKSTLKWLLSIRSSTSTAYAFPYDHVVLTNDSKAGGSQLSLAQWDRRLSDNFERLYFVPSNAECDSEYEVNPSLVNTRGIYKDVYGSTHEYTDYQMRPNVFVALAVAPELFTPSHACTALTILESSLLSSKYMGVKTLSADDWAYRGDYDNSSQSPDATVAGGLNYHQGPEWLWPMGYYLRARIIFSPFEDGGVASPASDKDDMVLLRKFVYAHLGPAADHMRTCVELGLPELTNSNGSFCPGSCAIQAWSSSTLLDALYDLQVKSDTMRR